ncbi:MAG: CocE/NonD family hydrolase [Pseudomonadota bacterium]
MRIEGTAGALEAHLERVDNPIGAAVLCHPHPQYGGSMHDMVLATAEQVLHRHNYDCLRFNFRGVGASEGRYAQGVGEVEDVLAAASWLNDQDPAPERLLLVGYSFGANMVSKAMSGINPSMAILIAPPNAVMDMAIPATTFPVCAIACAGDDYANLGALEGEHVSTHIIPGGDHFFGGKHGELAAHVEACVG